MRTITKLQIKKAIILEDARRITTGEKPINNISRLAGELSDKHPKKYELYNVRDWLYHAQKKGIILRDRTYVMEEIVSDLCDLLHISREELIYEIEL